MLDLKLSGEEIEKMHRKESGGFHPYDCCDPNDRRAIVDAAAAKAVLFFKQGSCWCSYGGPMVGHTRQCEIAERFVASIQKPGEG